MNRLASRVFVRRFGTRHPIAPLVGAMCLAAVASGCTLLLPTDQLIVPCQSQADCDDKAGDGFVCEDNACLPQDDGSTSD